MGFSIIKFDLAFLPLPGKVFAIHMWQLGLGSKASDQSAARSFEIEHSMLDVFLHGRPLTRLIDLDSVSSSGAYTKGSHFDCQGPEG